MIDYARARRTMVDTQIRVNDVTDARIVEALMAVPRETFVPEARRALAYLDDDLPLNEPAPGRAARYLMEPMVFARMLQAAAIGETDRVLDVGTATGYSAAVLSRLAGSVVALESDEPLAAEARRHLAGLPTVTVATGPLPDGAATLGPFDVILLEGSVETIPQSLVDQLADGGRLVAVVGSGRAARCQVHEKHGGAVGVRTVFDAAIPPLPGFELPRGFVF